MSTLELFRRQLVIDAVSKVKKLRLELDTAQDVLQRLEWLPNDAPDDERVCLLCGNNKTFGHKPECEFPV